MKRFSHQMSPEIECSGRAGGINPSHHLSHEIFCKFAPDVTQPQRRAELNLHKIDGPRTICHR